jgi:hypothetical protein
MSEGKIELQVSGEHSDVAYLSLSRHPRDVAGCVKRTVELSTLIPSYKGPLVVLDFDESDTLIGIEIVGG